MLSGPVPLRSRTGLLSGPVPLRSRTGLLSGPVRSRTGLLLGPVPLRSRTGLLLGPVPLRSRTALLPEVGSWIRDNFISSGLTSGPVLSRVLVSARPPGPVVSAGG